MIENVIGKGFLIKFITIFIYIVLGFLIYYIVKHVLNKGLRKKLNFKKYNEKRTKTVNGLLNNIFKYVLIVVEILLILSTFGINTNSLVVSLGVVGVVVGLALKDTLQDFVNGIFIITDRQFDVGDYVKINGFEGEIVDFGLRATRIRGINGEVNIISNSNLNDIVNYSQTKSYAIIDIGVNYKESSDKIINVLNDLSKDFKKIEGVIDNACILGIQELADSCVVYRIKVETNSGMHYQVRREILKMVKDEFDRKNIDIPYPQVVVHNG